MSKPHDRSKTGCLTCKNRRKKCDETRPTCERCKRAGMECLGYSYLDNPIRKPRKPRTTRNVVIVVDPPPLPGPSNTLVNTFALAPQALGNVLSYLPNPLSNAIPTLVDAPAPPSNARATRSVHATGLGSRNKPHNFSFLYDSSPSTQQFVQPAVPMQVPTDRGPLTYAEPTGAGSSQVLVEYPDPLMFPESTPFWDSVPLSKSFGDNTGTPTTRSAALFGALIGSVGSDIQQTISSARDRRALSKLIAKIEDEPEPAGEDPDTEEVMELISPALALDRDVASNSLPFILSSYLRWMTRVLFEPMTIAPLAKEFLVQRCLMSEDFRYTLILGATVMDKLGKDPELALGNFLEMDLLENRLGDKLILVKSGLETHPESYKTDAWVVLCDVCEMMALRYLSCSMSYHIKTLEQLIPVYQLACNDTPETLVHLQSRIFHPNTVFGHAPEMDILLNLSTCRPMVFQYDATYVRDECESGFDVNRIGLQWKRGIPNELLIMLGRMNMLRQDYAPNVHPGVVDDLETQISNFKPILEKSSDSYLFIARTVIQECWRQFMYIYLYMGLCGADSSDTRVEKALKRFIKVLNRVTPGRVPDAFLVTPISLAGIAAHKKRDRDIIRQRMRSVYECSRPGTYVNNAARILEEIWATADVQTRSAVWSDLRMGCYKVTGIA